MRELNDSTQFINNINNTFGNHGDLCHGSYPSRKVQLIAHLFILVFSLAGNVLIIAVFYRDKTLRTTVNYFIVNMCVSDLIFPIVILPIFITLEYDNNLFDITFPSLLCRVALMALSISVLVSLFSMTALAADRFRAIIFPMKPALFSPIKCYVAMAAIWISSISFLVYYATKSLPAIPSDNISCLNAEWTTRVVINVYLFFAFECLTGIILTFFYFKVAIFLYQQKNSLHLASEVVKKRAERNRKIITMLIIIVILFYVGWVPVFFSLLFVSYVRLPCVYVWLAANIFPAFNAVLNPVVYFVFNEKYRRGLMEILCCLQLFTRKNNN